jgi:hypothetical protein
MNVLTRRMKFWEFASVTAVVLLASAAAIASSTSALARTSAMIGPEPEGGRGPYVSAASFSGGKLHETLTFHKSGMFVAHVVPMPLPPSSESTNYKPPKPFRGPAVALGYHDAGTAHISFRLGALTAGPYAVVITPQPQVLGAPRSQAATWVYLTVHADGTVTNIKLFHP